MEEENFEGNFLKFASTLLDRILILILTLHIIRQSATADGLKQ